MQMQLKKWEQTRIKMELSQRILAKKHQEQNKANSKIEDQIYVLKKQKQRWMMTLW